MRDGVGAVQLWTISPNGGEPTQLTRGRAGIASAFTWSSDGKSVAHVMGGSICLTSSETGDTFRITDPTLSARAPLRPEACVLSPDGKRVAYVRRTVSPDGPTNHIFIADTAR